MQEAQEIDLLPCPFCGEEAEIDASHGGFTGVKTITPRYYIVDCVNRCNSFVDSKEKAILGWNRRWMPDDVYTIRTPKEIKEEWESLIDE